VYEMRQWRCHKELHSCFRIALHSMGIEMQIVASLDEGPLGEGAGRAGMWGLLRFWDFRPRN
jgi:hypothetical protein